MAAQLTVSQILAKAAEILDVQGWTRQGVYEHTRGLQPEECPLDLGAALAMAAGIDMHSLAATTPTGIYASAVLTVFEEVYPDFGEPRSPWWALSALSDWQDKDGRTAEEVIAALRAAASPAPEAGREHVASGAYLPGQLYEGRDGDLLYVVLPGDEVEFVTNRGTRLSLAEAERVYAPLTMIRDVVAPQPSSPGSLEIGDEVRVTVVGECVGGIRSADGGMATVAVRFDDGTGRHRSEYLDVPLAPAVTVEQTGGAR